MKQKREFPNRVPRNERPTPTIDAVPDEIVAHALDVGTRYASCPGCGTEQWFPWTPEETTGCECRDCGKKITII